jgi:hypothetical protein
MLKSLQLSRDFDFLCGVLDGKVQEHNHAFLKNVYPDIYSIETRQERFPRDQHNLFGHSPKETSHCLPEAM